MYRVVEVGESTQGLLDVVLAATSIVVMTVVASSTYDDCMFGGLRLMDRIGGGSWCKRGGLATSCAVTFLSEEN